MIISIRDGIRFLNFSLLIFLLALDNIFQILKSKIPKDSILHSVFSEIINIYTKPHDFRKCLYGCVCVYVCVCVCVVCVFFFPMRWRRLFTHHVKSYSELPVCGARQVDGLTCLVRWMDQIPLCGTLTH